MFKNYLLVTLRNIRKNSTYSFLNIIGLAVGMATSILIVLYVQYEASFDRHHEYASRIFRVIREGRAFTPSPLGPELKEKIPDVESAARILRQSDTLVSLGHTHFLEEEFYWADPETFKIFSIPIISGDPETALNDPFTIVLSQGTAKKYFGDEDPMGKMIVVSNQNGSSSIISQEYSRISPEILISNSLFCYPSKL